MSDLSKLETRRHLLERVLRLVAGPADLGEVERYMTADVVVHLDRLTFRGLGGWRRWMRYSHARSGLTEVELELLDAEELGADRLRVRIGGRGRRGDRVVVAEPVWIVYRFVSAEVEDIGEDGADGAEKLAEMWTSRRNYTFFFGPSSATLPGFAWLLLRIMAWNLLNP